MRSLLVFLSFIFQILYLYAWPYHHHRDVVVVEPFPIVEEPVIVERPRKVIIEEDEPIVVKKKRKIVKEETVSNKLVIEDIVVGTGATPQKGKKITVHYTGMLTNGKKFDSSHNHGQPFTFTFGVGQVIKGWDEGLKNMKVGGKRKLTIPSELGYGELGAGDLIPPHSTLIFEVELLSAE